MKTRADHSKGPASKPAKAEVASKESNDSDKNSHERNMTMNKTKSVTKDPVCGMTVDEATAIHNECDGKTYYFCSDGCRQKFLSSHAGTKPDGKSGGYCG